MPSRMRLRGASCTTLLCLSVVVGSGAGCAPDGRHEAPVALLRAHFPQHADRVLGAAGGAPLVAAPGGDGFVPATPQEPDPVRAAELALRARGGLRATFPAAGDGQVRFTLPDGFALQVRELGPRRRGQRLSDAMVYAHGDGPGASFWSATAGGYEEWLLVAAPGTSPVAQWEVTGATLRQRGEVIEVVDRAGTARVTVTAPAAYAESGAPVQTRLAAAGARLTLTVEGAAGAGMVLVDPLWQVTGSLSTARVWHSATLLPSGKVLVAGGYDGGSYLDSAELYDPGTDTWTPAGAMATARIAHTATLLPSGKVLVVGGAYYDTAWHFVASAELYDPGTDTWNPAGDLAAARDWHTATLLPSGKVLVAGGTNGASLASAYLYDPVAGTFAATTGPLATPRGQHTATLLPSGKVLIAGGQGNGPSFPTSAELYDPGTDTFAPTTGPLASGRYWHTATLLPSGTVLLAGGYNNFTGYPAAAELYDPVAGTFAATTGPLATPRCQQTATLLSSGKVLVAGGYNGGYLTASELYDPVAGTFAPSTGALATGRSNHSATLLPSGTVLVAGGYGTGPTVLTSAELYDPLAGTFAPTTGLLTTARGRHTVTLLPSGKVLIAGGWDGTGCPTAAELYDPATGTFAPTTGPLTAARAVHTATLLPSGKVLLAGGSDTTGHLASAELYDPATGTFTPTTGSLATARRWHTATLLPSGKVLVAGGCGNNTCTDTLASAELYDPMTGTFAPTAEPLADARFAHTATLLPSGQVLVTGGGGLSSYLASAELYDPAAGTFARTTAPLATARFTHTATLLPSGKVLLAGGQGDSGYLASAELFDPATGTFAPTAGPLVTARRVHAATLLPSGKVLLAGGQNPGYLASAELYDPATETFAATTAPMAFARYLFAATLLHSGKVLVVGGWTGAALASAELYDEGRGALPAWAPTLGPLGRSDPGDTVTLAGTLLTGLSEGSTGATQSSATNYPLLLLRRVDSEQMTYAPTSNWSPNWAVATLPPTLLPGPYVAWVVTNGILSNGSPLLVSWAGCEIGGTSYASGTANPANPCESCDPPASVTAWTARVAGFPCTSDGLACTADVCDGAGTCDHPLSTGCLIAAACVTAGATNPGNECEACDPAQSTAGYSDKPRGLACTDEPDPTTDDICDGSGACIHPLKGSCEIGGTTYASGTANPANPCESCDPPTSVTAWTARVAGFPCTSDGLACTADVCDGAGTCDHTLYTGCLIAAACVAAGAPNPGNECQACDPVQSTAAYSDKPRGLACADEPDPTTDDICDGSGACIHPLKGSCVIGGTTYASGTANPANPCEACDPPASVTAWTARVTGFPCTSDGLTCTADVCDGAGTCDHPLYTGCLIAAACVAAGADDPGNECAACRPEVATTAYSSKAQGVACTDDGLPHTVDVCDGAGACTHLGSGTCVIGGTTYASGAANPANPCESCAPTTSATAWTARVAGFPCTSDGLTCTADVCDGAGTCDHTLSTGCLIAAACVAAGAPNPANECQACDPAQSTAAYSNKPRGLACADEPDPTTDDICDGSGACIHPLKGSCQIGGTSYASGAANPVNPCESCDPPISVTAWTVRVAGFPCTSDGLACTNDVCDGAGTCGHALSTGCLIAGACVAAGAVAADNECQVCNPSLAVDALVNQVDDVPCADDGDTDTQDVCRQGVCTHPAWPAGGDGEPPNNSACGCNTSRAPSPVGVWLLVLVGLAGLRRRLSSASGSRGAGRSSGAGRRA